MVLTYEQFCHIVNDEILYLDGEIRFEQVLWGTLSHGAHRLPCEIELTLTMPDDSTVTPGVEPDLVEYSYEFSPASFVGTCTAPNIMHVRDLEGEIHEIHVYHEVPVDLAVVYHVK